MSGGGLGKFRMGSTDFDTVQSANKALMDFGKKTTLKEMRALTFEELLTLTNDYAAATKKTIFFGPIVDHFVSDGSFDEVARAGNIADVPYMFGYTANDLFDMTQAVVDFCALRAKTSSKPAYAYVFSRQLPGDSSGAFHSADLWYIFHSFRYSWRPFTAGDKALSTKMIEYWTNFARWGNPNGAEDGIWTSYSAGDPKLMELNVVGDDAACTMTGSPKYLGSTFKWR